MKAFRIHTAAIAAMLVLGTGLTAGAAAHSNQGNHCGRGHAKHARAVGQTCAKHHHGHRGHHGHHGDRDD
jgi:Spy/CpxP family protein refolding chaperone